MYTNTTGISMSVALWLATDNYDYNPDPKTLSATTIIKPMRQLALGVKKKIADKAALDAGIEPPKLTKDISSFVQSRIGTAVHDAIETAWLNEARAEKLQALGVVDRVAKRLVVNPTPEQVEAGDIIPVYMEIRAEKKVLGYTITGKYDMVLNGELTDFKYTKTYSYTNSGKAADYVAQGSIYKWLNPEIITEDIFNIEHIFCDWMAFEAKKNPKYPAAQVVNSNYILNSPEVTQRSVENKLRALDQLLSLPEESFETALPRCSEEDLWKTEDTWKYYADKNKVGGRSTRNFTSNEEAVVYMNSKKPKTEPAIIFKQGEVKACLYCDVRDSCKQKDEYIQSGSLKLPEETKNV